MNTDTKVLVSLLYGAIIYVVVFNCDGVSADTDVTGTVCPDARFKCQEDQTCCTIGHDQFGCCPYNDGVCCDDKKSCCPNGFVCNNVTKNCNKKKDTKRGKFQPFVLIQRPTISSNETLVGDNSNEFDMETNNTVNGKKTCPDGKQTCPESYTCCAEATGGYGCCPLTGGICCEDKVHCCPMGTQCNTKLGSCEA